MELVIFADKSKLFEELLEEKLEQFLSRSADTLMHRAMDNTPVKTGKTRSAWKKQLEPQSYCAVVGNTEKNSLWEEFGTGQYALSGNGRKDGWVYHDKDGFHFTEGKPPHRCLLNAFVSSKEEIKRMAEEMLSEVI